MSDEIQRYTRPFEHVIVTNREGEFEDWVEGYLEAGYTVFSVSSRSVPSGLDIIFRREEAS